MKAYSPPESKDTGSEIEDSFVLASFLRGEKSFDNLIRNGIFHRKLFDVGNAWNSFEIYQLYSPEVKVTGESILGLFQAQTKEKQAQFLGKGICDSVFSSSPCSPNNTFRVVKLGSVKSVSSLKLRAVPIAILQRLGLVDQVLPLSNFYFKVRLCSNITDQIFTDTVTAYNKSIEALFTEEWWLGAGSESVRTERTARSRCAGKGDPA